MIYDKPRVGCASYWLVKKYMKLLKFLYCVIPVFIIKLKKIVSCLVIGIVLMFV